MLNDIERYILISGKSWKPGMASLEETDHVKGDADSNPNPAGKGFLPLDGDIACGWCIHALDRRFIGTRLNLIRFAASQS